MGDVHEMMNKQKLENEMKMALEKAKSLLLKDGRLVPVAFIHSKDGIDIFGLIFKDQKEKEAQMSFLKKIVREKNADAIFLIMESWYVTYERKDLDKNLITPSKNPMRKECIFVFGECGEGNKGIMQEFEREKENGEKIVFGKKVDLNRNICCFDFGIKDT